MSRQHRYGFGKTYQANSMAAIRKAARSAMISKKRASVPRPGFQLSTGYYGPHSFELKFHDLDVDDAVVATNGTIAQASCNIIAQGTTDSTRIGRKVTIKSINWRFRIGNTNVNQATARCPVVRVVLFLDKQCNGTAATVTDILETDNYQSFNNLANKSRFVILFDRTYKVENAAGAWDGTGTDWAANVTMGSFYKKCNIPIEYDSTTGAITECRSNNLGVLLLSDQGTASFESKMRLRYTDI